MYELMFFIGIGAAAVGRGCMILMDRVTKLEKQQIVFMDQLTKMEKKIVHK